MLGEPAVAKVRMRGGSAFDTENRLTLLEVDGDASVLAIDDHDFQTKWTRRGIQRSKDLGEIAHQLTRRRVVGIEPDVNALHRQALGQSSWASSRSLYF